MSAAAAEKKTWTASEYLELERSSGDKADLFAGEIFAMAGASYEHNLIVGNLVTALNLALGERRRVLPSDMRLHVRATSLWTRSLATSSSAAAPSPALAGALVHFPLGNAPSLSTIPPCSAPSCP